MKKMHRMFCARWNAGTGHGTQFQPLTLAFFETNTSERAVAMGGHAHAGYEIVPVFVTIEEDPA